VRVSDVVKDSYPETESFSRASKKRWDWHSWINNRGDASKSQCRGKAEFI